MHSSKTAVARSPYALSFLSMSALSLALFGGPGGAHADDRKLPAPDPDRAMSLAQDLSAAFQRAAKDVTPSVVHIATFVDARQAGPQAMIPGELDRDDFLRRFFGDQAPQLPLQPGVPQPRTNPRGRQFRAAPQEAEQLVRFGTGSGIIVSADGYILTNNHVIENAKKVEVAFDDERKLEAKVIGRDPETDLAVLKVEGEKLPFATLGDSDKVSVGEWVLAIGNPFDLNSSVTAGIISAKGRQISGGERRVVRGRAAQVGFEDFLQTDAAINPGNSGGALVNLRGQVIGINTSIFTRSGGYMGIGFAIPSNLAKNVFQQLRDSGTVQRGYLGIEMQALDEATAKSLGFEGTNGVLVLGVPDKGPAATAGIKAEDVILSVDGRATPNPERLRTVVATTPPGREVAVEVFRGGERKTLSATLAVRDEAQLASGAPGAGSAKGTNVPKLGLDVAPLTDRDAERLNTGTVRGMLITRVEADSRLNMIGIQADDIIVAINGQRTPDAATFNAAVEKADFARGVRLLILRDGVQQMVTIQQR